MGLGGLAGGGGGFLTAGSGNRIARQQAGGSDPCSLKLILKHHQTRMINITG